MTLCLAYLFWLHLRRNTSPLNASSRAHFHACTMPPLFYWLAFSLLSCPFASCSHRVSAPVWHPSYVAPSIDACLRVLRILHLSLRSLHVASATFVLSGRFSTNPCCRFSFDDSLGFASFAPPAALFGPCVCRYRCHVRRRRAACLVLERYCRSS